LGLSEDAAVWLRGLLFAALCAKEGAWVYQHDVWRVLVGVVGRLIPVAH
jgi:hypothetical protein